ncbi:type VII secretion protein EccB [Kutzneria sp. 744]|uniref:type VII secretion protein EccB n=1 Tax=Kutzneria sp. (strain 744) TaxID=345341 RepID=UPI0003EEB7A6|nr:type VII secretion protein EccB [Kutzneria sp. 744]EWM15583.1 membrane protein [Kutzneria sp. 744]
MPSTPTSKSQVQAYRFMLRRMESALVRKDSVMMHDPMGSHMRSAVVGVLLAMVAAIGFVLFAVLSPAGSVPEANGVVIGKQSGAVYALITDGSNNKRLVPTFNVTSARLILLANSSGGGGGQAGAASPAAATPAVVDDDVLKGLPRDKKQGLVDGPQMLPVGPQRVGNFWDVCDTLPDNADKSSTPTTSVIGGVDGIGSEISLSQPLLVTPDRGKSYYLIYRKSSFSTSLGLNHTRVVKSEVDLDRDKAIANAYRLQEQYARPISSAVLNAVPGTVPLSLPDIPGRGEQPTSYEAPAGAKIGDVLHTVEVDNSDHYYVLVAEGRHEVSPVAAEAIYENGGTKPHNVEPGDVKSIPLIHTPWALDEFPVEKVNPVDYNDYPAVCAAWSYPNNTPSMTMRILEAGKPLLPNNVKPIKLGTPSTDGTKVADFYLPTGQAAVVRDSTSTSDERTGPVYVVSDLGVRYGFASSIATMTPDQVAAGVGLGDPASYPPAPDAIVKLLPQGTALDPGAALRTYDTMQLPADAGSYPTAAPSNNQQAPPAGGSGN